jgi:hypothetical protein
MDDLELIETRLLHFLFHRIQLEERFKLGLKSPPCLRLLSLAIAAKHALAVIPHSNVTCVAMWSPNVYVAS